jgi:hypothetical protein
MADTRIYPVGDSGASDAADLTYTPTTLTDWDADTDPGNADDALDQLAERVDDLEGAGVGGGYWEPLTNGDAANPALIFADGDVIMVEVL